ncbi:hypothetical protein TNCV_3300801 [Trichonephila clavipes]|nr:hypothetical protein TNCV_3300801 [Trichonephila clavipes]
MSRTPTRFKQHRVTTTRPMNCYTKVSPRLGRSRHRFFFLSHRDVDSRSFVNLKEGRSDEEAAGSRDTILIFAFALFTGNRDYTGMWVRPGQKVVPYSRKGCVLAQTVESNQGGRFDGNESVADSFRSGAVSFKKHVHAISRSLFPLTSARKTSPLKRELPRYLNHFKNICLPRWYPKLVVLGELAHSDYPGSYAGGSLTTGRVTQAGQVLVE